MHVECVAGGAPSRPRPTHERVAADDRVEAVDQRGGERPLHRRQGDPTAPEAQQAVVVDDRRDRGAAGPRGEGRHPHPEVVLGRRETDPVLERIHGFGGGEVLAHQEETRRAGGTEPLQSLGFLGPSHQDDVGHLRTVRRVRYGSVTPQ